MKYTRLIHFSLCRPFHRFSFLAILGFLSIATVTIELLRQNLTLDFAFFFVFMFPAKSPKSLGLPFRVAVGPQWASTFKFLLEFLLFMKCLHHLHLLGNSDHGVEGFLAVTALQTASWLNNTTFARRQREDDEIRS